MEKNKKSFGDIMHGLSKTNVVSDDVVFDNMPTFPRISRSKGLTLLLVSRVKNWTIKDDTVYFYTEAHYVDEKYTYRYFDYRHVFLDKPNTSTITVAISFNDKKVVRIRMEEGFKVCKNETEMIKDRKLETIEFSTEETEDAIEIKNGELSVRVTKNPWNLQIMDNVGKIFYQQFGRDNHSFMPYEICPMGFLYEKSGEQYACEAIVKNTYERYYGIGENFTALDRTGRAFDLWNTNSLGVNTERAYKYIPFYISSNGYGVFYNTSRKIRMDMGASLSKAVSVMVSGKILDYFVIRGETIKELLPLYYNITGWPCMPPKWSFGLWISKISYGTRKEVETVAKKMRCYDVPCDVIHVDTDWFAENWICDWKFDDNKFPDVEEMIENLHKDGFKLSLWQLPYIERGSISYEVFDEAMEKGYFAERKNGDMQFAHGLIDLTNPEAVEWYKNKLIKPLLRKGVDVIKVDFGESAPPFFKYAGEKGEDMHNLYSLLYNKIIYEATKEELGEENALIWARSAWAGSQKYPVHWGGDSGTDFGSMESSLKGCLNASLSGIPFWSSDIGGFFFDTNPVLYTRWSQFGMFCSHARLHGFYTREPWDFGQETFEIFQRYVKLRYRLLPYIYNQSKNVVEKGELIHRPMAYEFPSDNNARGLDTQYLFGKDILVAPVLNETGDVEVYLPEGIWTDFHSDEVVIGPTWIQKKVPLDIMPIYIRENGIIPMQEEMNYVDEKPVEKYEIHLYPAKGENKFAFYDENSNITLYSDGNCAKIQITPMKKELDIILHNWLLKNLSINGKKVNIDNECHIRVLKETLKKDIIIDIERVLSR